MYIHVVPGQSNGQHSQTIGILQADRDMTAVATALVVHRTTVCRLRIKFNQTSTVKDSPRPSQPRTTNGQGDRSIILRERRKRTNSAIQLQDDVIRTRQINVSLSAISRHIRAAGLTMTGGRLQTLRHCDE